MKISRQQLQQTEPDFNFTHILRGYDIVAITPLAWRVFAVFGGLGCAGYLQHLASSIFQDSWVFPIALTAMGLGIIYLGILWQCQEAAITGRGQALLPQALRELHAARVQA